MSNTKRALVIVAHGSRREASNEEIRQFVEGVSGKLGKRYRKVEAAFLELAEPSIPNGIEKCIRTGAEEVIVLPYFLTAGRHVTEDIPAQVELMRKQYPHTVISIAGYLGADERVADLMASLV